MQNEQYEEISLKELILLLLKGWKTIIVSTIITLSIAIGLFFVGNSTTYTLSSKAILSYFPSYVTQYGIYNSNLAKTEDVVVLIQDDFYEGLQDVTSYQFSVENLKNYVAIKVGTNNTLEFTYSGLNSVDLQNLQSNVDHTFGIYVSKALQENARKYFVAEGTNSMLSAANKLTTNNEIIPLLETELKQIPMTVSPNLINPAYSSLASKIQDLKNENIILNYTKAQKFKQIEDLQKLNLEETLPTVGIYAEFTNDPNVVATQQFNAKTLFPISLVLGLMVGIFLVLFINYWKTAK